MIAIRRNFWLVQVLLVASLAGVGACSSSSPTSNTGVGGGLPAAASVAASPKTNEAADKITIKGRVLDARSGEPIANATVLAVVAEFESEPPSGVSAASATSTDSASASTVATGGAAIAGEAPKSRPVSKSSPSAPVKTTADEKGNFEIKDLPSGTYSVSAVHKGYVAVSFVGGRPASGKMNLSLAPQDYDSGGFEVSGAVKLLSRKPGAGVTVAAALPPGLFASGTSVTDTDGGFTLSDLPTGKHLLAAWTKGDAGEIKAWGFQKDVGVAIGKDKKTSRPEITLRAISKSIILAGKVTSGNKAIKPRQVQVFLTTEQGEEVALLTRSPDQDGYFRFSLPAPDEGMAYHLVASGLDSAGNAAYAHTHKIAGPSHAYDLVLPELPATPSMSVDAQTEWTWTAVPDVSVYRVRLESSGDQGKTLWEGWTTGTGIVLPQIAGLNLRQGDPYRFSLAAIRTQGAFELPEVGTTPWAQAANLAPREFVAGEAPKEPPPPVRTPTFREQGGGQEASPNRTPSTPTKPIAPPVPKPGKLPAGFRVPAPVKVLPAPVKAPIPGRTPNPPPVTKGNHLGTT